MKDSLKQLLIIFSVFVSTSNPSTFHPDIWSIVTVKIWISAASNEWCTVVHTVIWYVMFIDASNMPCTCTVTLSCSGESVSQRRSWFLFHFSDGTTDTSVGVYRMLCGGEAAKSKKRTKSSEQHALGQTASVGGLGHYAAPLGER